MDGEEVADAVSSAVAVVPAVLPQDIARAGVKVIPYRHKDCITNAE